MKRFQVNVLHAATAFAQGVSDVLSGLHNSALASYGVQLSERSASLRRDLVDIARQKQADMLAINDAKYAAEQRAAKLAGIQCQEVDDRANEAHDEVCSKLARINEEIERVVNARTDLT